MKNERAQQSYCHNLESDQVVALLETNLESGLSASEAARRRQQYGPNELRAAPVTPAWKRLLSQFRQPLVYILLGATLLALYLGEYIDAGVIIGVVVLNAIVGFVQESKAETAINALKRSVAAQTTVRRDGVRRRIPIVDLVPGDIVLLESGETVPADLRLFQAHSLQINESLLTGESAAVHKHTNRVVLETVLADRKSVAFAGTSVTSGRGEGIIWATGNQTEMGRIASLIREADELSTPLTRKIAQFSRMLLWFIVALAILTVAIGLWHGENPVDMFMAAVALAVGATPEGLPAAVTITLAIGVARMARRRAIIRKLPAVETLGSTTIICSDKTGTLTQNSMTVHEIFAGGELFEVTGAGYEPTGAFKIDRKKSITPAEHPALIACLRAGLLCNDTTISRRNRAIQIQGDPTEAALIIAAEKAGLSPEAERPRIDVIPFESGNAFMATLHRHERGHHIIYKKGAVERLVDRCATMLDAAGREVKVDKGKILAVAESMANHGLRVLAFAQREVEPHHHRLSREHVETGLAFLGLQAMMDPPRPEAIAAVARCQRAGIGVKMITGDHLLTAKQIAKQIGLLDAGSAISGRELDQIDNEHLPDLLERTAVFARVAPEQKLRLVRALQSRHHIVAMTGDGVNDAPALKQADIGVAMGITGTDVARNAADMVLADDNFASIEAAVEEGRNVFDNLTKFIVWTLPTNAGEALILITAICIATPLPALPLQLLWINMSETIFGLPLAFEPKETGLMERPPRNPRQPIFTRPLFLRTIFLSILMLAGAFALFMWELDHERASIAQARTVVVNFILATEGFYLFNCRSLAPARFGRRLSWNPWLFVSAAIMTVVQLFFTYTPFMNAVFGSAPIALDAWLRLIGVALICYAVIGLEKRLQRLPRRKWRPNAILERSDA